MQNSGFHFTCQRQPRNRFLFAGTTGGNKVAGGWRYIRETHTHPLSANTWEMPLKLNTCTASHLVAAQD